MRMDQATWVYLRGVTGSEPARSVESLVSGVRKAFEYLLASGKVPTRRGAAMPGQDENNPIWVNLPALPVGHWPYRSAELQSSISVRARLQVPRWDAQAPWAMVSSPAVWEVLEGSGLQFEAFVRCRAEVLQLVAELSELSRWLEGVEVRATNLGRQLGVKLLLDETHNLLPYRGAVELTGWWVDRVNQLIARIRGSQTSTGRTFLPKLSVEIDHCVQSPGTHREGKLEYAIRRARDAFARGDLFLAAHALATAPDVTSALAEPGQFRNVVLADLTELAVSARALAWDIAWSSLGGPLATQPMAPEDVRSVRTRREIEALDLHYYGWITEPLSREATPGTTLGEALEPLRRIVSAAEVAVDIDPAPVRLIGGDRTEWVRLLHDVGTRIRPYWDAPPAPRTLAEALLALTRGASLLLTPMEAGPCRARLEIACRSLQRGRKLLERFGHPQAESARIWEAASLGLALLYRGLEGGGCREMRQILPLDCGDELGLVASTLQPTLDALARSPALEAQRISRDLRHHLEVFRAACRGGDRRGAALALWCLVELVPAPVKYTWLSGLRDSQVAQAASWDRAYVAPSTLTQEPRGLFRMEGSDSGGARSVSGSLHVQLIVNGADPPWVARLDGHRLTGQDVTVTIARGPVNVEGHPYAAPDAVLVVWSGDRWTETAWRAWLSRGWHRTVVIQVADAVLAQPLAAIPSDHLLTLAADADAVDDDRLLNLLRAAPDIEKWHPALAGDAKPAAPAEGGESTRSLFPNIPYDHDYTSRLLLMECMAWGAGVRLMPAAWAHGGEAPVPAQDIGRTKRIIEKLHKTDASFNDLSRRHGEGALNTARLNNAFELGLSVAMGRLVVAVIPSGLPIDRYLSDLASPSDVALAAADSDDALGLVLWELLMYLTGRTTPLAPVRAWIDLRDRYQEILSDRAREGHQSLASYVWGDLTRHMKRSSKLLSDLLGEYLGSTSDSIATGGDNG